VEGMHKQKKGGKRGDSWGQHDRCVKEKGGSRGGVPGDAGGRARGVEARGEEGRGRGYGLDVGEPVRAGAHGGVELGGLAPLQLRNLRLPGPHTPQQAPRHAW
jgi:hypothetical protein